MMTANITADRNYVIGTVEKRMFGSFIEQQGSCVYNGIYEPDHPTADEDGFRRDVLEMTRKLNLSVIRFPGGNYTSGYDWMDGIGPREQRPKRLEYAWKSIDPNQVRLHEYVKWIRKVGAEPLMTINLGTGTVREACRLVEYANFPQGTQLSDLRIANGQREPFNIRTWCLGNELDGEWQLNHRTAYEYGRIAAETARALHVLDPRLEFIAVGSSSDQMSSYPEWDREVLEHTYRDVDYLALHKYIVREERSIGEYLALPLDMEKMIRDISATCDYVKARLHTEKVMKLAFDEFMPCTTDGVIEPEPWLPSGEERDPSNYHLAEALAFGLMLITMLRHCDRVKIACQSILINCVPLLLSKKGGPVWANTTYYPMLHASQYCRGKVLRTLLTAPGYDTKEHGRVDSIDYVAVWHDEEREIDILAVNRSPEPILLKLRGLDFPGQPELREHIAMEGDLELKNTQENPLACIPHVKTDSRGNDGTEVRIGAYSWNVLRFGLA